MLGAFDTAPEGGSFEWMDGTAWDFEHWAEGEPNNRDGIEDCIVTGDYFTWNDFPCAKRMQFLCQFPPGEFNASAYPEVEIEEEEPDFITSDNGKYTIHKPRMTKSDASKECKSRRGNLMSINTVKDKRYIKNYIEDFPKRTPFWIGVSGMDESGTFVWEDGSDSSWKDWVPGQPSNLSRNGCAIIMSNKLRW